MKAEELIERTMKKTARLSSLNFRKQSINRQSTNQQISQSSMFPLVRSSTRSRDNERGQILLAAVGAMVILLIFIPALVYYVQHEVKWTIKGKRSTIAFHLAEAGVDRGYWKLLEDSDFWDDLGTGQAISGYNYDQTYTDIDGGEYTVSISSHAAVSSYRKIVAVARDSSHKETRAIEVVYNRETIDSSLSCDSELEFQPNFEVHWGKVVSYDAIEAGSRYYPRKYCKGAIDDRDDDPAEPNSDNIEYWAFYSDLTTPPDLDFDYYVTKAKNSRVPALKRRTSNAAATSNPAGSGYYTEGVIFRNPGASGGAYSFSSSTSVIVINGNADFLQAAWVDCEAVIVLPGGGGSGDVDFNARSTNYTVAIPTGAAQEYQHPDAAAVWTANFAATGEGGNYTVINCGMHGFLYVGGEFTTGAGGAKMVGAIKVVGETGVNSFTLYFDRNTLNQLQVNRLPINRVSWKEVKLNWPR